MLSRNAGFSVTEKWWMHKPQNILENSNCIGTLLFILAQTWHMIARLNGNFSVNLENFSLGFIGKSSSSACYLNRLLMFCMVSIRSHNKNIGFKCGFSTLHSSQGFVLPPL